MVKLISALIATALISTSSQITINVEPFCESSADCAGSSVSLVCGWYTDNKASAQGRCMNKDMCGKPYRPEKPETTMVECPDLATTNGTA